MIETYTLYTSEIDSPSEALQELQHQLSQLNLRSNTVGIVVCHYDSIEYDVIATLQENLPFPLIGCTTFYKATPEISGLFELTITVLTSNTVEFSLAFSDESDDHGSAEEKITATYQQALGQFHDTPSLILSFISANRPISGDEYLRILDDASGKVPSFGLVDSGEDESGANTYIICKDKVFTNGVALLVLVGEVNISTYVTSPTAERLLSISAVVTSSEGTLVKEINNQTALSYLQKNDFDLDIAENMIITSVPVYFHSSENDAYVCRLIKSVYENGTIEFLAEVPQGSLLRIGTISSEEIQEESKAVTSLAVAENPHASLLLAASCVGRFITLGIDITSEMEQIASCIPHSMNFLACYVGGEICPIVKSGMLTNTYHNNSLVILALS